MCARRNDLVGTFLWVQSKCADNIALRTTKAVTDTKLSSAKSVEHRIGHELVRCSLIVSK
jgi:hypothetical protein